MSFPSYTVPVKGTVSWQSLETSILGTLSLILEIFDAQVELQDVWDLLKNYRGLSRNFRDKILEFRVLKTKEFRRGYISYVSY